MEGLKPGGLDGLSFVASIETDCTEYKLALLVVNLVVSFLPLLKTHNWCKLFHLFTIFILILYMADRIEHFPCPQLTSSC